MKVQNGWITLSGNVEWQYQKLGAEQAVRKLSGVVGVTNFIAVSPAAQVSDIKSRTEQALVFLRHVTTPPHRCCAKEMSR